MGYMTVSSPKLIGIFLLSMLLISCGGGAEGGLPEGGNTNSTPAIIIDNPGGSVIDSGSVIDNGTTVTNITECSDSGIDTIRIAWDVPTAYSNDEPLNFSSISSYRIYYGSESRSYPYYITIDDPSLLRCAISGLGKGTFYLSMTTILIDGTESSYSSELTITI